MDVVNPEQAAVAEDAGAVAVMALERVPADIPKGRWRCSHEPPRHDSRNSGLHVHPGHGQVQNRTRWRGPHPRIHGC